MVCKESGGQAVCLGMNVVDEQKERGNDRSSRPYSDNRRKREREVECARAQRLLVEVGFGSESHPKRRDGGYHANPTTTRLPPNYCAFVEAERFD